MARLLAIPAGMVVLLVAAMLWSGTGVGGRAPFAFVNRGDIKTLDPNRMSWMQDIRVGLALWEGLYLLNPKDLEPGPGAASGADVSPDKLVYTFHIRPTAKWSNGDDLTAGDFVFAWRRALEQPADYTYLFYYIKGAKAYSEGFAKDVKSVDFSTVGINAVDPKTLRVTFEFPIPFVYDLVAFPSFFPQHERSMEPFKKPDEATGRVTYDGKFTRPPFLVSNGPYRLESWQFKGRFRMVANEHYWDRANVKTPVVDQVYAEGQIAYEMYERGVLDWVSEVPPEIAAALREQGRTDLHIAPALGTYFYTFNCLPTLPDGRKNPFADARVRRALNLAVDKRPIVANVTRMGEPVTSLYIPANSFDGYPAPPGLPYDVPRAKRLMAEAGYPGGQGFPAVELLFNNEFHHGDIAQVVRRQWQENLGINVALQGVEIKIFGERLHTQQYAVARASWYGDYNDPTTFTDKYRSYSENNDSKWANAEYDRLCEQADRTADNAERLKLLAKAEHILLEEAPILPLYQYLNVTLSRDEVRGLVPNPKNMVQFKAVEVRGR